MKKLLILAMAAALPSFHALSSNQILSSAPNRAEGSGIEIITTQPEGELLTYDRTGYAWYDAGSSNRKGQQTGTIDVVFAADNKVYLKQPLSKLETDAWIAGTLDAAGTTLTVPMDQCLGFNEDQTDSVILKVLEWDEDYEEYSVYNRIHEMTYTIAPDRSKITLNGTSSDYILGAVWSSNNEWTGYGDYSSVYTPAMPNELVTPPASLEVSAYQMNATSYIDQTSLSYPVSIGFDGEDIYVKGIFVDCKEQWIKGTKQGENYVFPSGQYLGQLYGSDYFMVSTPLADTKTIQDFELTWDEATESYVNSTQYLIESGLRNAVYMTEALSNISIKKVPETGLTYPVPYIDDFASAANMGNYTIVDGNADSLTWYYNSTNSCAAYDSMTATGGSDDWLITPAITLTEGVRYIYTVSARSFVENWPENIEVKVGTAAEVGSMTATVIEPVEVATGVFTNFSGTFTPTASGNYYFGLHAITPNDQMTLSVNRIALEQDPDQTAIETVNADNATETVIYTIDGRRINKITAPGIYIINGKKRVVLQ